MIYFSYVLNGPVLWPSHLGLTGRVSKIFYRDDLAPICATRLVPLFMFIPMDVDKYATEYR